MTADSWHSYPKVYAIGHAAIDGLLPGHVLVEEKVDGSQFSFGVFDGALRVRSHGVEMDPENPEKMFGRAVETAKELKPLLIDGWTYRAEYLAKPKHNTIAYSRTPEKCLVLFDVNDGNESYLPYGLKCDESERIGLEVVPRLFEGDVTNAAQLFGFLDRDSFLGGAKIEGVVVKGYEHFGRDGKVKMGKYVSEAFKEKNAVDFRQRNPTTTDIVDSIIAELRNEARWAKAAQHLAEDGRLSSDPSDIGALLKAASRDVEEECAEEVGRRLWEHYRKRIIKGALVGLPEWYKRRLAESAFAKGGDDENSGT